MKKFIFLLLILPAVTFSQELAATVVVSYEQLDNASKERLVNFKQEVENYLNTARYTDEAWEGDRIPCQFNIFFTGASKEINYGAQIVISSQRPIYNSQTNSLMMRVQDKNWQFIYERNQALYFNQTTFDPLTSLLDYYAYLILGFDADSFEKFGGSEYFAKAYDLAVLGANSRFSDGWSEVSASYSKRGLVEDLSNAKYEKFRKAYFNYHYNGLDIIKENQTEAVKNLYVLIDDIYENYEKMTRSVLLRVFFEAKAGEIVDNFAKIADKSVFEKLKIIDPAHITKYNEVLDAD